MLPLLAQADAGALLLGNLLSPVTLAFLLGLLAVLVRSDLRFPEAATSMLSTYLLLAIGLKGGSALAGAPLVELLLPALATLALGVVTPLTSYAVLRRVGRLSRTDAAAIAAHYGSVSAVTFLAALAYVDALGWRVEGIFPGLVALLEVPAILVALALARRGERPAQGGPSVVGHVLSGKSVLLLLGGMGIGLACGSEGLARLKPFFVDPFQGVLMLFLLDLGLVAGQHLRHLRTAGPFLCVFALLAPIAHGALGVLAGSWAGLSVGGCAVLGAMTASASYIAAPAAVRMALPEANPAYYLTTALGITFPFNLTLGIPLYVELASLWA
ncbi:MAG: sodium-dependent bicarbonate transport family permease [Planctomycetia bacterium]